MDYNPLLLFILIVPDLTSGNTTETTSIILLTSLYHYLRISLLSDKQGIPLLSCTFLTPVLESVISPKSPGSS